MHAQGEIIIMTETTIKKIDKEKIEVTETTEEKYPVRKEYVLKQIAYSQNLLKEFD